MVSLTPDQIQRVRQIIGALPASQRTLDTWVSGMSVSWGHNDRPSAKYLATLAGYPTDDKCTSCDADVLFGLLRVIKKADDHGLQPE